MRLTWMKRIALALPVALLLAVLSVTLVSSVYAQAPGDQPPPAPTADPSGIATGSGADLGGVVVPGTTFTDSADYNAMLEKAKKDEPFAANLADYVNQNRLAVNFVWVLVTGYLVMFMQAGFAMVETGFCRAKSAMQVMMTNFMVYGLGMLAFWVCGFAFMFGGVGALRDGWTGGPATLGGLGLLDQEWTINGWGILGHKGFFLGPNSFDVAVAVMFLFQMVFMDTAATILTGAVAERWKWGSFILWSVFVGAFLYPVFGNWVWGGGWLSQMGESFVGSSYFDFAGSGVVHSVGGWAAFGAVLVLGPRLGKYNADGTPNAMPGHNLNMAAIGCFILAFGWFGFNPGSSLGASGSGSLRIGVVAVVTMLAGAAGSASAMFYAKMTLKKWDPGYMMNGLLAGLVAITAPSGFVSPISAVAIGAIAGVLVCMSMVFMETKLKVDDPVGAISVHGVCGIWGVLSVGIFADGTANWAGVAPKGILFGDGGQLVAQAIGAVVVFTWATGMSWIFFKILMSLGLFRSSPEDELAGLDLPEMGTPAYPLDPGIPEGAIAPIPGGGFQPRPALGGV